MSFYHLLFIVGIEQISIIDNDDDDDDDDGSIVRS